MKIQEIRSQKSEVRSKKLKNCLVFLLLFTVHFLLFTASAHALTVQEVAADLACPCECPLVLEDCNMSCGLDWKDQIGQMISQGKTKEEIIKYFIDKYGDAARITPLQRIQGKIFKYTRAFGTWDWVVAAVVGGVWLVGVFIGIYLLIRRFLSKKSIPENLNRGADR